MKESYATVLMDVMNDSIDVGAVDDRRKKTPPDNFVVLIDHNKMLQNKNAQGANEEDNFTAFESKLNRHSITYFKQQDVDTRLCGLHSLNNESNKRTFSAKMLWNIQQRLCHYINVLVAD
eukprot:6732365-Ditylum_brightwellii.AAC.1